MRLRKASPDTRRNTWRNAEDLKGIDMLDFIWDIYRKRKINDAQKALIKKLQ